MIDSGQNFISVLRNQMEVPSNSSNMIFLNKNFNLPITSATEFEVVNQASSPNFPILYFVLRSFGNPHTTDMK